MRIVDETALKAAGNEKVFETLVQSQKGFLINCIYRATHRWVTESDDAWSVALLGFSDAVKSYDPGKGAFLGFAETVVRNRLVDWHRSQRRFFAETPTDPIAFDTEPGDDSADIALHMAIAEKVAQREPVSLKEEIEAANAVFERFGFCFMDLTRCSPKSKKTREACKKAVNTLLKDADLQAELNNSGQLPIRTLTEITGLPRKLLDNHRRYIIAANELLSGDYPGLAEYLTFIKKAGQ